MQVLAGSLCRKNHILPDSMQGCSQAFFTDWLGMRCVKKIHSAGIGLMNNCASLFIGIFTETFDFLAVKAFRAKTSAANQKICFSERNVFHNLQPAYNKNTGLHKKSSAFLSNPFKEFRFNYFSVLQEHKILFPSE